MPKKYFFQKLVEYEQTKNLFETFSELLTALVEYFDRF